VVDAVPGDVEECLVQSLPQSQFTPLPEALCWVILELTSAGQPASLDAVRAALQKSFPVSEPPSEHTVYDALAKLTQERKVCFIVDNEKKNIHFRGSYKKKRVIQFKIALTSFAAATII
jgi:hypothetical protein